MKHSLARIRAFLCLLVGLCPLLGFPVMAESESEPEPESRNDVWLEHYERADWVSRVRIESIGSLINPSMSQRRLVAVQGYRYSASVLEGWKGEPEETVKFQVDLGDCRQQLEVDREYVVFASINYRGRLQSDSCEHLVLVEDAAPLLSALEKLSQSSGS